MAGWGADGDLSTKPESIVEQQAVICTHSLDRRKLEFSGFFTVAGW